MRAEARALLGPAVFTALMVALSCTLGVWQLRRLAWKEALIAKVETRAHAAPVDLPPRSEWRSMRPEDYDFLHARATGRFDLAREALIFAPPPQGAGVEPGYRILTPFALEEGGVVLVDRGFLPISLRETEARRHEPTGKTTIVGVLRSPQARNLFTPADDPNAGLFYTSDAPAIAAALKLEDAAPFTLELDAGDSAPHAPDLPRAYGANVELVNNHLSYAVTWFSLAAAIFGGFVFYARSRHARS
ncbi:SURF1 family protein [Methylosinus sp. Sm6]|uniref:SURF1 family protein n=1 Tax=Methylosinus sp. Sm6 TaxID=2866948 RepID=UPI001C99C47B|nr:SURF1 family protein [Methylosinus sp. Sm6]MBY6242065.1 SURF1 family protein [Methylosinus sp. Sm6]